MTTLDLKPSEIFYSQATISGHFGRCTRHKHKNIGDTLDALYYGRIRVRDIPTISVVKKDDKWVTLDNRRLWLFHHLQGAGKCDTIPVNKVSYYECLDKHSGKFSSKNGGTSITFSHRNGPGGKCYWLITPVKPRKPTNIISETTSSETVSVRETKPHKTQSYTSNTAYIETVHPRSCVEPKADATSVKRADIKLYNTANKDFPIQTKDHVVKIKTDYCRSIKEERDKIRTRIRNYSDEVNLKFTFKENIFEQLSKNNFTTQKPLNKISKDMNMLKTKLNRQHKLKRQTLKPLKRTNTSTKNNRTYSTRLPQRHHCRSPTYCTRKHTYNAYTFAEALRLCRLRVDAIMGNDVFSSSDEEKPMCNVCSRRRIEWIKRRYRANQIICRQTENISTEDDILNEESEEANSKYMYASELNSDFDNAGSDVDNMEMDYEDEPYYFYEVEDCHATFDTLQTIPTVSDTSDDEKETSDDDEDDDDGMDNISDNYEFTYVDDENEQEDDINAYDGHCFKNELCAERNIQSLNESKMVSDDDKNDESEDDNTDYDYPDNDEESEDYDETDNDDDEAIPTGNINWVPDGERPSSDRNICNNKYNQEVNEVDEYQNEKKWFYDCFDNCYRKIKK